MGLLDDAIKEHLELKRRRGADPTEIERLEREALGPVRRMAQEGVGDEQPEAIAVDAGLRAELGPRGPLFDAEPRVTGEGSDEPEIEEDTASHELLAPSEPGEYSGPLTGPGDTEGYDEAPTSIHQESAVAGQEPAPAPEYELEDGPETAEYDIEADHEEGEHPSPGREDDMLEETPEFLQDAPEHDRLWFEQRPPRDFDFDG